MGDEDKMHQEPQVELRQMTLDQSAEYYANYLPTNRDLPGNRELSSGALPDAETIKKNLELHVGKEFFGIYDQWKALVGVITATPVPHEVAKSAVEIGYVVDQQYGKRGFATAAVKQMVAEQSRSHDRIVAAGVVPDNDASKKILERLGFTLAGVDDDGKLIYEYVVLSESK